jgi:hypothetical protein
MTHVIVDFILPEPVEETTSVEMLKQNCGCGSNRYTLVSELEADCIKGIPASRMYECLSCGAYRLG